MAWPTSTGLAASADLVLAFGATGILDDPQAFDALRRLYPSACIVGCSTGGEILNDAVQDDSLVITAAAFQTSRVREAHVTIREGEGSHTTGARLARALLNQGPNRQPLVHVLVLADGVHLNGSSFIRGVGAELPRDVSVTGGLAADGEHFERTPLWANGMLGAPGALAVGFYGNDLQVGYGAVGGWNCFGPDRLVTRSEGNVLYSLDDQSALSLYKQYLGPHAEQLPASGLLFPLGIRSANGTHELVRSTLGIDEEAQSITFAGDVPEGAHVRFMKTNIERLIDGAVGAAEEAKTQMQGIPTQLALLISCVGRKWVMKQRTEEEIESVQDELGPQARLTGFYSYGEIAPTQQQLHCDLHNQTMTITTLAER